MHETVRFTTGEAVMPPPSSMLSES